MKKHPLLLIILFSLGLFAMKTFWGPNYFDGHDAQAHLVRLYQFDQALKDGQLPPRWAGSLLAGRGYPIFIFVYPLPYFIAEAFHLIGFSLAVALKLTFTTAYLTSLIGMYFFAFTYWQSVLAGFLASFLWSWSPPLFEKIFIGGALGEVTGFAFIPFALLLLYRLIHKPQLRNSFYLSLFLSFWVLSHLLNLTIFLPLFTAVFVNELIKAKDRKLIINFTVISALLAFGLTAWYFLPAVLEMKFTYYADFVNHQYADQFVSFQRLIYSKWGTDAPGWGDNPVSQQIGISQWLSLVLASLLLVIKRNQSLIKKFWPFLFSFAISVFLMLPASEFIWVLPTPLQKINIPWRFLSLSVFSASVLAGGLAKFIKPSLFKNIFIIGLICLNFYANRNHLRINQVKVYDQTFFNQYTGVVTAWNEHLPIWVKDSPDQFAPSHLETLSGNCRIISQSLLSNRQQYSVDCFQPSVLRFNTAYYPGWKVTVDSQNITESVKNNLSASNGMIQFYCPSGTHQLQAEFTDTPLRFWSTIITLFTLFVIVIYYLFNRFGNISNIFKAHMRVKRQ